MEQQLEYALIVDDALVITPLVHNQGYSYIAEHCKGKREGWAGKAPGNLNKKYSPQMQRKPDQSREHAATFLQPVLPVDWQKEHKNRYFWPWRGEAERRPQLAAVWDVSGLLYQQYPTDHCRESKRDHRARWLGGNRHSLGHAASENHSKIAGRRQKWWRQKLGLWALKAHHPF